MRDTLTDKRGIFVYVNAPEPLADSTRLVRFAYYEHGLSAGWWKCTVRKRDSAWEVARCELVGISFGFLGFGEERRSQTEVRHRSASIHLHSHITGVAPGHRGRSVGFALKQFQRSWALAHDVPTIEWTADPLVRGNVYFNLVKLGASIVAYHDDFYGPLRDRLNAMGREHELPMQVTGVGSIFGIHFHRGPIRNVGDLARGEAGREAAIRQLKALFHLDMLAAGQYLSRRLLCNLSLETSEAEVDGLCDAIGEFLASRGALIREAAPSS